VDDAVAKLNSLDFLRAVYLNNELPLSVRMRAARDCLPFEVPKLAVLATLRPTEGLGERLEAAIRRSLQSGPRLIEGEAVEVAQGPPGQVPPNHNIRRHRAG